MANRVLNNGVVAHRLVAQTAVEMANELYELVASDNGLWVQWKAQCPGLERDALRKEFVRQMAPLILEEARATLAKFLGTGLQESLKEQIMDALIKDKALGRTPPTPGRQLINLAGN